jgi:hypothetical protein
MGKSRRGLVRTVRARGASRLRRGVCLTSLWSRRAHDRSADWKKVRATVPEIEGEQLKRPPPGSDPASPFIEDLKRKGFTAGLRIPDGVVTKPNSPDQFVSLGRSLNPLNRFLARAVEVGR